MDEIYFLRSDRLGLRPLRKDDIGPRYLAWLNDPEVNQYSGRRFRPTSQAAAEQYLAGIGGDAQVLAICILNGGVHIGNIKYGPVDWCSRCAEIEILIGDKPQWGKGYGTEAIGLLCGHLFLTLKLHRVEAKTANPSFVRAVGKLGWKQEGVMRDRFLAADGFRDYQIFSLLEDEFARICGKS
jgi:ribosomal-protein-alanine N-acetyltransferase